MSQTPIPSVASTGSAVPRIRLAGALTDAAVDRLRARLDGLVEDAREVVLDAAALVAVEPAATARLLVLCERLERRACAVRLVGLPPRLARALRLHPLLAFATREDARIPDPFVDPFATDALSRR